MPTILGLERTRPFSMKKSGKKLLLDFEDTYRIKADNKSQRRLDLLYTPGLPQVNDQEGPTVVKSINFENDDVNPLYWTAKVGYSSDVQEGSDEQTGDPTTFKVIGEIGFESETVVQHGDVNGDPVNNTAGDPFEQGIAHTRTLARIDFEQFEPASTSLSTIIDRNETINKTEFVGAAEKTLKLTVKGASLGFYYGYRVWRIDYSMVYKKDNWNTKWMSKGRRYLTTAGDLTSTKKYFNEDTLEIDFLKSDGTPVSVPSDASVVEVQVFETAEFSDFLRVQG